MLKGFTPEKIYLATGYTDLRKGIDGLAGIVQEQFQLDHAVQAVGERKLPLAQNDTGSNTDHRKAV